jgi:hypothetical protein
MGRTHGADAWGGRMRSGGPPKIEILFYKIVKDNNRQHIMNHTATAEQEQEQTAKQTAQQTAEQTQEKMMKCEAANYGKCGGPLTAESVVWHVRPRHKDLARGHCPHDTTLQVDICTKHHKQITDQYCNRTTLPDVYGWDKWDALDGLTARLHYTGFNPIYCACQSRIKDTVSETGACTKHCISLIESGAHANWYRCKCSEPVKCICDTYDNNDLHWFLLTYVNGFNFGNSNGDYYHCDACVQPSWRDTHEFYKNSLMPEEAILSIAKKDPRLIYQKNAKGISPFGLIEPMIEHLEYVREEYYVKSAESGWAGSNVNTLTKIKKGLMLLLDSYTNW